MPNNPGASGSQPLSLEKRLPIALALMMGVLLASQYFFKPAPGPKPVAPINDKAASTLAAKPATTAVTAPTEPSPPSATGQISAGTEYATDIDTALYRVTFTNRGAAIKSWVFKHYTDTTGKPLEVIDTTAKDLPLPFTIDFTGQKPAFDPNTVLYQSKISPDRTGISYDYSDGKTTVHKSFQFSKDSYQTEVKSVVLEGNTPVPHLLAWRGGFGDMKVRTAWLNQHTVRYDAGASKLVTKTTKDAKNGPITDTGDYTFGGLEDNFFAAVAVPKDSSQLQVRTYSDQVKVTGEDKPVAFVGAGISTGPQNVFDFYVGPKDIDILRKVSPKLGQIVDWGFFGIIAKPLFLWLNWVNDHWTNNYGWAIILVTLIINLALFPFRFQSLRSARKMQKLQPQIASIKARYKDVGLRDPRKAEENTEVMALYKKEGVNPVGGCLPMLVQLPFFYAFYRVLSVAIELRHAPWLWVIDLSGPESLPIHLLPLILIATQFATQKLTPAAGVDPSQQKMMMFMPLMFGFMFYSASAGLVLYWLTGNLVGIVQQLAINRFMPPTSVVAPPSKTPPKAPVKKIIKK